MLPEERFRTALLRACGLRPAPDREQVEQMYRYYEAVLEANRRFNLTRIVEPEPAAVQHFADALALLGWTREAGFAVQTLLDVGTGAGFPAVPLAIMRPSWEVTAIDSTGKKIRFVTEAAAHLGLPRFCAEQQRAGQWHPSQPYDLVTFKAVGNLARCISSAADLVRPGGMLVLYKTPGLSEPEQGLGLEATRQHGFEPAEPYPYELPTATQPVQRVLWIARKAG